MIRVRFEEPAGDEGWISWRAAATAAREEICRLVAEGREFEIDAALYKKTKRYIFDAFHGKCAYCETLIDDVDQPGDVEHFRPKKRVMREDGKPEEVVVGGKALRHMGYYWLAYDWRNLLPACALCNRPRNVEGRRVGKADLFPLKPTSARAIRPDDLLEQEEPLFIHPVLKDPQDHFDFVPDTGFLVGKTEEGRKCIEVLDLNREGLTEGRRRKYDEIKDRVSSAFNLLTNNAPTALRRLGDLKADKDGHTSYTFAARRAFSDARKEAAPLLDLLSL